MCCPRSRSTRHCRSASPTWSPTSPWGLAALGITDVLWLVILYGIIKAQTEVYRLALESRPDLASGIPAQRAADLTE